MAQEYRTVDLIDTVPMSEFQRCRSNPRYWYHDAYIGPGVHIPPRREDCRCACSALDDIGRPRHIGLCPDDDCERRPR